MNLCALSAGYTGPMWLLLPLACTAPDAHPPAVLETVAEAVVLAEQGAETWPAEPLVFDWMPTVWAWGIHRLFVATGDDRWLDYPRDWMLASVDSFRGDEPRSFFSSDSMSPALLAVTVMVEDPATDLVPIIDAAHAYLDTAPRVHNGAIAHWGPETPWGFPTDQVWIDSQFMFGVFLVREFERTGDRAHLDAFIEQYGFFLELCRDDEQDLYFHAWDDDAGTTIPTEAAFWARGNAWVLISAVELLAAVGPEDRAWDALLPHYVAHAEALAAHQDASGLWHTILNQPRGEDEENYLETSGSALIGSGLARGIHVGALDEAEWAPVVARVVAGVREKLEYEGEHLVVRGTSFGTNPGDYEDYVSVVQVDDLILGVGATVALLAEADGLPAETP